MTDYKNMGVNSFYQPYNAPVTSGTTVVSGYDFQANNERSVVTGAFLRTFTADKIVAGTLDANTVAIVNLTVAPSSINTGTITNAVNVGTSATGYVKLDGPNNRIVVNDGTTNRIIIGNI